MSELSISFFIPGEPVAKGRGKIKATNEQIIEAYEKFKSVKKAGEFLGMCGQSVHERLVRLGLNNKINLFTREDRQFLFENYNLYAENGKLEELAIKLKRDKTFICNEAKKLGLTNKRRSRRYNCELMINKNMRWKESNYHSRRALGMKHSQETKDKISLASLEMWKNKTQEQRDEHSMRLSVSNRKFNQKRLEGRESATWKAGWREIGGIKKYYRSKWEANYARYLQFLKEKGEILSWAHEPKTFWFDGIKRGCMSYLPDFHVVNKNGSEEYHEVKGWTDERSATKLKRMEKYFPEVKLVLIQEKSYKTIARSISMMIKDWE